MACKEFLTFNNGEKMPILGIGTWQAPENEVEEALNLALEAGYRHIDCAPVYLNEKVIGRVLKSWIDSGKVKREDLFITTKLPPPGNRPSCVERFLKKSLNDLQLDYVDLYLIHCPFTVPENEAGGDFLREENGDIILDLETDHIATWKVLEEMVQKGLTKSIGISNFNQQQVQRLIDNSTIKPANLQIELHLYLQQNELVDFCKANGITVVAYAPLGSRGIGALMKMCNIERELPDLLNNKDVIEIGKRHNKTAAQVLIRWIIQRGISTIPKSTNPERLKQNLNIFDFKLTEEEMQKLASLDAGIRVCDFAFFKGMEKHPEFPFKN